jgi:hypothetical protein
MNRPHARASPEIKTSPATATHGPLPRTAGTSAAMASMNEINGIWSVPGRPDGTPVTFRSFSDIYVLISFATAFSDIAAASNCSGSSRRHGAAFCRF